MFPSSDQATSFPGLPLGAPFKRPRAVDLSRSTPSKKRRIDGDIAAKIILPSRLGTVLNQNTILKADQFNSGVKHDLLDYQVAGCPNFRKVSHTSVYGVAQPSFFGICSVLNHLGCNRGENQQHVVFVNLREEPAVYINQRSFVLRDQSHPFQNLSEYNGITSKRLEEMEKRLKEDIIREASLSNNNILVHTEAEGNQLRPTWEAVSAKAVYTPSEVFQVLQMEGYKVDYVRIPITPERTPGPSEYQRIISCLVRTSQWSRIVFNCQMGRGRTTMAMVIACMYRHALGQLPEDVMVSAQQPNILRRRADDDGNDDDVNDSGKVSCQRGEYRMILKLLQLMDQGPQHKLRVDFYVQLCSHVTHLLDDIFRYKTKAEKSRTLDGRRWNEDRAAVSLRRYFHLICLSDYFDEQAPKRFEVDFVAWMDSRRELLALLEESHRDSRSALESGLTVVRADQHLVVIGEHGDTVMRRSGMVLCKNMILKAISPMSVAPSGEQYVKGAPDFHVADADNRVFGVHCPSVPGTVRVIKYLRSQSVKDNPPILWINTIESPLMFVNENPYQLRDAFHPHQPLYQYEGLDGPRVEGVEDRLRQDVLQELGGNGGMVLLHAESVERQMQSFWKVTREDCVETSSGVFDRLEKKLGPLEYHRLPIVPGIALGASLLDRLVTILRSAPENAHFVITSPTAVVAASLFLKNQSGACASTTLEAPTDQNVGMYHGILRLVRVIPSGIAAKREVDLVIDQCARKVVSSNAVSKERLKKMREKLNIRDVIDYHLRKASVGRNEERRLAHSSRAVEALKRYFLLIAFNAYVQDEKDSSSSADPLSFEEWLSSRGELETLFQGLQSDPLAMAKAGPGKVPRRDLDNSVLMKQQQPSVKGDGESTDMAVDDEEEEESGVSSLRPADEVVSTRCGHVLGHNMILKVDHFPGCQRLHMEPRVDGAPNFRSSDVPDMNVYGAAMPTVEGIRHIFAYLGVNKVKKEKHPPSTPTATAAGTTMATSPPTATPKLIRRGSIDMSSERATVVPPSHWGESPEGVIGVPAESAKLMWVNLREEPILYINDRPFVLRNANRPFVNLEHTGISQERVHMMEARLKSDVLDEIKRFGGYILLHGETQSAEVEPQWEVANEDSVLTPSEVYEKVVKRGYPVRYIRIPVTDEQAWLESSMELLVKVTLHISESIPIVFNCQMGRGRTTTGMVVGCLTRLWHARAFPTVLQSNRQMVVHGARNELQTRLRRGQYKVILSLMRLLDNSARAKEVLDLVVDSCSSMQNLREAILECKTKAEVQQDSITGRRSPVPPHMFAGAVLPTSTGKTVSTVVGCPPQQLFESLEDFRRRKGVHDRGIHYLKRYFSLLVLSAYFFNNPPGKLAMHSFGDWYAKRAEFASVLENISLS